MTRVLHVGSSDAHGGAQQAMIRIHNMLLDLGSEIGIDSSVMVNDKQSNSPTVDAFPCWEGVGPFHNFEIERNFAARLSRKISRDIGETISFPTFSPTRRAESINSRSPDVVNLHWLGKSTLSILDLKHVNAPLVWTLHDQWPILGFRHYEIEGSPWNPNEGASSFQLKALYRLDGAIAWLKRTVVGNRIKFIAPSEWMRDFTISRGTSPSDVFLVPYPAHLSVISPALEQRAFARENDRTVRILFISSGGIGDRRKGFEMLARALEKIDEMDLGSRKLELTVVGGEGWRPSHSLSKTSVVNAGDLGNREVMEQVWRSDFLVMPSVIDNFPLVSQEALLQGTPVIGLSGVGNSRELSVMLGGIVVGANGAGDLADALVRSISRINHYRQMRVDIAREAFDRWGHHRVAPAYAEALRQASLDF